MGIPTSGFLLASLLNQAPLAGMSTSKSIIISLPENCNENWDEMKPNACGRFCTHCEKTVIDFTSLSDDAMVKIMLRSKDIPCGRFTETQLNRSMSVPVEEKATSFSLFSKMAASFLLLQTFTGNAFGQKYAPVKTEQTPPAAVNEYGNQLVLKGSIKDYDTHKPLIGMVISVEGLHYVKYADVEGRFQFVLPESFRGKTLTISADYLPEKGLERPGTTIQTESVVFDDSQKVKQVKLYRYRFEQLEPTQIEAKVSMLTGTGTHIYGGVPVIRTTWEPSVSEKIKRSFGQKIKHLFKRK
jgi:hypothetical protein